MLKIVRLRVIDGIHFALITHGVYAYVVTNYVNPSALTNVPWCVISPFVALTVTHTGVYTGVLLSVFLLV